MERDAMISIRLPQATRAALQHAAGAERRSMSDLALIVLTDWLAERGHLPKAGQAKRRGKG